MKNERLKMLIEKYYNRIKFIKSLKLRKFLLMLIYKYKEFSRPEKDTWRKY